jgi:hypothetical protein
MMGGGCSATIGNYDSYVSAGESFVGSRLEVRDANLHVHQVASCYVGVSEMEVCRSSGETPQYWLSQLHN